MTDNEIKKLAKQICVEIRHDADLMDLLFPQKMMSVQEAADFLGISKGTMYHKVKEVPCVMVDGKLRFSKRRLLQWMKNRE